MELSDPQAFFLDIDWDMEVITLANTAGDHPELFDEMVAQNLHVR